MASIDRPSWPARLTGAGFLALALAAPVAAGACDMNAVNQELAREQAATPLTVAANNTEKQSRIILASPSPDNEDAAKSSSNDKAQSSGNGQGSGSSQSTQQKQ